MEASTATVEKPLPHVQVRAATYDDLAAMVAVIHAAYEEFRGVLVPPSGAHGETVESVRVKLERGGGYLALDGENAVGSLLYEPRGEGMYVGRVAVLPMYRRYGIGRMLMQQVETLAHRANPT